MSNKVIPIGSFYMTGTLRFYIDGSIGVSTNRHTERSKINKYVVLDSDSIYDCFNALAKKTHISPDYCCGDPIWVHPKARLSRDLIRKSGYAIIRDKEKANYLIIPEPDYNQFSDLSYNIALLDGDTLYLFTVRDGYNNRDVPGEKYEAAKERLKSYLDNQDLVFLSEDMELKKACFFPALEEYKELYESDEDFYDTSEYVFDTKLRLTPNVDISPETLDLWSRTSDLNMVARLICASDWSEYPLTMKLFLENRFYRIKYLPNNNISMITKQLEIGEPVKKNMIVTEKDLNMLMSYIFYLIGKPIGSTYITENDWDKIPGDYRKFLKKRVAISPVVLSEPQLYSNIINEAKN